MSVGPQGFRDFSTVALAANERYFTLTYLRSLFDSASHPRVMFALVPRGTVLFGKRDLLLAQRTN